MSNLDSLISPENIPASNWFKFENVGDKIGGEITDIFDKTGHGDFPDQKVFVIKHADTGELVNVGIKKTNDFLITRTKNLRQGDMVAFVFEKEIPPTVKGRKPAKSIQVYYKKTDAGDAQRNAEALWNSNKDDVPFD